MLFPDNTSPKRILFVLSTFLASTIMLFRYLEWASTYLQAGSR